MSRKRDNKGRYVATETKGDFIEEIKRVSNMRDSNNTCGVHDFTLATDKKWLLRRREDIKYRIDNEITVFKKILRLEKEGEITVEEDNYTWGARVGATRVYLAVLNFNEKQNLEALEIECDKNIWKELSLVDRLNNVEAALQRKLTQIENRLKWFDEPMPE